MGLWGYTGFTCCKTNIIKPTMVFLFIFPLPHPNVFISKKQKRGLVIILYYKLPAIDIRCYNSKVVIVVPFHRYAVSRNGIFCLFILDIIILPCVISPLIFNPCFRNQKDNFPSCFAAI